MKKQQVFGAMVSRGAIAGRQTNECLSHNQLATQRANCAMSALGQKQT